MFAAAAYGQENVLGKSSCRNARCMESLWRNNQGRILARNIRDFGGVGNCDILSHNPFNDAEIPQRPSLDLSIPDSLLLLSTVLSA